MPFRFLQKSFNGAVYLTANAVIMTTSLIFKPIRFFLFFSAIAVKAASSCSISSSILPIIDHCPTDNSSEIQTYLDSCFNTFSTPTQVLLNQCMEACANCCYLNGTMNVDVIQKQVRSLMGSFVDCDYNLDESSNHSGIGYILISLAGINYLISLHKLWKCFQYGGLTKINLLIWRIFQVLGVALLTPGIYCLTNNVNSIGFSIPIATIFFSYAEIQIYRIATMRIVRILEQNPDSLHISNPEEWEFVKWLTCPAICPDPIAAYFLPEPQLCCPCIKIDNNETEIKLGYCKIVCDCNFFPCATKPSESKHLRSSINNPALYDGLIDPPHSKIGFKCLTLAPLHFAANSVDFLIKYLCRIT